MGFYRGDPFARCQDDIKGDLLPSSLVYDCVNIQFLMKLVGLDSIRSMLDLAVRKCALSKSTRCWFLARLIDAVAVTMLSWWRTLLDSYWLGIVPRVQE